VVIWTELIRPVAELLVEQAAHRPEKIAFLDERRQVSYRELAPAEVAHILDDSGATVVITDAGNLGTIRTLAADRPGFAIVGPDHYRCLLSIPSTSAPRDCLGLDDVAWMLYTSGTTGRPKGVYLTQRGCLWVVAACWAPIVGLGPDDVVLSPLPLFRSYALVLCVLGLLAMFHYLLQRAEKLDAPGSCGLPLPGLTVRLVDPAAGTETVPDGEGEIWVRGPNVTPGYHNLPEATATDGWYHTGDLARRDEHRYQRISGRTKELIIRGGEHIYPAEVEDEIDEIPRTGSGKILRSRLRESLRQGVASEGR